MQKTWKQKFDHELRYGEKARADGNEGMARVCARRAVGFLAKAYLNQHGIHLKNYNIIYTITYLTRLPHISPQISEVASRFLEHITQEHILPQNVDLIADARWLENHLINNNTLD